MSKPDSDEDLVPDNCLDRSTIRLFYDILNVKLTHGIDFQSFFDLLQQVSDTARSNNTGRDYTHDDYLHESVLDIFCKNFIRGFSKLIVDLGFDNVLLEEME